MLLDAVLDIWEVLTSARFYFGSDCTCHVFFPAFIFFTSFFTSPRENFLSPINTLLYKKLKDGGGQPECNHPSRQAHIQLGDKTMIQYKNDGSHWLKTVAYFKLWTYNSIVQINPRSHPLDQPIPYLGITRFKPLISRKSLKHTRLEIQIYYYRWKMTILPLAVMIEDRVI